MPNEGALVPELDPLREKSANEHFGQWLAQKRPVTWFVLKIASKIDPKLMRLTGGRLNMTGTNAVVVLHHVGAKTGHARQTPLLYFTEGRNVVLVAGNGRLPRHPAWLHNVRANPNVELWVGKHGGPYRARVASAEERAVLPTGIRMTVACIHLSAHGAHSGSELRGTRCYVELPEAKAGPLNSLCSDAVQLQTDA